MDMTPENLLRFIVAGVCAGTGGRIEGCEALTGNDAREHESEINFSAVRVEPGCLDLRGLYAPHC